MNQTGTERRKESKKTTRRPSSNWKRPAERPNSKADKKAGGD